jgi:uroporphyrinogen decarboxylase
MNRKPDFQNLRRALTRECEPDYVPIVELGVDYDVKCAFLGRPVRSLADEVEFWHRAGYDYVPMQAGIRKVFWPGHISSEKNAADHDPVSEARLGRTNRVRYSLYREQDRNMSWAEEGTGAISNLDDFERYPWPDPATADFSAFDQIKPLLPPGMRVMVNIGCVFTSAWMLMGMENFFLALKEQPELIRRLYDRIWSIQSRTLLRVLEFDVVGAVFHTDDLAHASGTLVSPRHLREYVFPWYRWSNALVRDRNLPRIYHSDGRLDAVLDDLVGCGFNALHPIEPKAMDIAELKKKVGGKMCLIGNIDLGYTLTLGSPREVDAEVRERIRTVGPGGGYCVGSSNSVTAYVPLENFNAMREAAFKYGSYPLQF